MSYVTGISGNVISAASAGWAPTNSAEVSAIASAYATGKQDALTFGYDAEDKISSIDGSALAGGGGLVTAIGTSESGITSLNNFGLVDTDALHSADYSSLYVQEPLYISASGDSSYIGISGDIGGIDSATCSAIASAYVESGVSSKQDTLSFGYDDNKISAINGSALAGEAQVVTAVGTETAYTPDGVGDVVTSINGNYISALSADSAFQASYDEEGRELTSLASEYVVSSIASSYAESAVSGKADSSALSSYALSADVSGTVDLVSTQSANWGGSALALSAGPGVKLEKVGDTLVASTDETLLWSGTTTNITGIILNETYGNFDRVRFYWKPWSDTVAWRVTEIPSFAMIFTLDAGWASNGGSNASKALFVYSISSNGTAFSQIQGGFQNITGSSTWATAASCDVVKVVGINRTAGV